MMKRAAYVLSLLVLAGCYDSNGTRDGGAADTGRDSDSVDSDLPDSGSPDSRPPMIDSGTLPLEFGLGTYEDNCAESRIVIPLAPESASCSDHRRYLEVIAPRIDGPAELRLGGRGVLARFCELGECEDVEGELVVSEFSDPLASAFVDVEIRGERVSFSTRLNFCGRCEGPPEVIDGGIFIGCGPDDLPIIRMVLPAFGEAARSCDPDPEGATIEIELRELESGRLYDVSERSPEGQAFLCNFEGVGCTPFLSGTLEVDLYEPGEFMFGRIVEGFVSPGISFDTEVSAAVCTEEEC